MSSWPCLEWNIFSNGIKVIIYAYAHMIIEYYDLKLIYEIGKLEDFEQNKVHLLQIFAKEPTYFFCCSQSS